MRNIVLGITSSCFLYGFSEGMESPQSNQNPVAGINYTKAFDQSRIYEKYSDLMEHIGCDENLKFSKPDSPSLFEQCQGVASGLIKDCQNNGDYIAIDLRDNLYYKEQLSNFQNECLDLLKTERRTIILRPAYEQGYFQAALLSIVGTACYFVPSALPFSLPFVAMDLAYNGKVVLRALNNWLDTPRHSVDEVETIYAIHKCFIPNQFWKPIEDEFLKARGNQFSQNGALNFLEFTLGLTVYKRQSPLNLPSTPEKIYQKLHDKVDGFFSDYEKFDKLMHLPSIKRSIADFIRGILGGEERPRYIYLHGSLGIGKTFFTESVNKWIEELLPNRTCYFDHKIRDVADLEGGPGVAGVYLSVLKNLCKEDKTAAVLLIDEATWLNRDEFIPSALKVFEKSKGKLQILYSGEGKAEKNNIEIDLPPILTFVAGNDKIENKALSSRFNFIEYPLPKKSTLIRHAIKNIKDDKTSLNIKNLFKDSDRLELNEKFQTDLEENILDLEKDSKDPHNFRDTEALAQNIVTYWEGKQRKEKKKKIKISDQ